MLLAAEEAARWERMRIRPAFSLGFTHIAANLVSTSAKARYQAVEVATKVPWFFVAVVHEREASQSWRANLAQGDPWNERSIHVPRGRGPFNSWEAAACDALENCGPYAARNKDWSVGGLLVMLEEYNGLGYEHHGIPSPYLWAGTDQYDRGKYVADGHFDPDAVDHQLGCAGLLKVMMHLDASIEFQTPSVA